ncbi:MAG: hypothetical protein LBJ38_01695 [Oscillospiraceae bacterium]|nr:hypothetical protein [Oscillospiraceae bacterium]
MPFWLLYSLLCGKALRYAKLGKDVYCFKNFIKEEVPWGLISLQALEIPDIPININRSSVTNLMHPP